MNHKMTDEDLLKAIQAGDEVAFKIMYDKYYRMLCYSAYKTYPDEHKSKDFAQEVFLDLWRKRDSINIQTSIAAYLKRAVINKSIDFIRAQRFNFGDTAELEYQAEMPVESSEQDELKALIHKTAEQLPERCRLIFFMSRFENLSHKEIAANLEISEKTIENQITKALKILRVVVNRYLSEARILLFCYFFY